MPKRDGGFENFIENLIGDFYANGTNFQEMDCDEEFFAAKDF